MSKSVALLLVLVFLTASCIAIAESVSAASNSWASKAPMQVARSSLGVAVVNDKIYAIGGDARGGNSPYTGSFVGTNEEYNPATDAWTFKASIPTPRSAFAIVAYQNKIYCIGGITGIDDRGRRITGVTEVYDPATDTWETKTSMPTARWALQANVVNGKIYLIGGYIPDDSAFGGSITALNEVYDPKTDFWTTGTPIPVGTSDYPSAVVDNKIYITGGLSSSPQSDLNQIYDPETDTWSQGALMPSGIRYGASGATTGVNALKRIYFFDGSGTQVYDPMRNRWTGGVGETMPTNRLNFRVAVVNDALYVIGGYTRSYPDITRVGDFIKLYPTNEQYLPFGYGRPDPSYDGTAPKIAVASPQHTTYHSTDIALDFTVNESVSQMSYVLDGETAVEITGNITLTSLSYGSHNLTVYATDAAGNIGSSETVYFTIAGTEPEPEPFPTAPVVAVSGASATVISIGLLVYLKKHQSKSGGRGRA